MRHDNIRDLFLSLCSSAYNDVQGEVPLSGEVLRAKSANLADDARADARVRSFWRRGQNAFFDFKVFYPYAKSYVDKKLSTVFKQLQMAKSREYEQRVVEVDGGSFTPMVMSSLGSCGQRMSVALQALALKLASKHNDEYAHVMGLLRCRFAFACMRSTLICLRGSRPLTRKRSLALREALIDSVSSPAALVLEEIRLDH